MRLTGHLTGGHRRRRLLAAAAAASLVAAAGVATAEGAWDSGPPVVIPGNLLITKSVFATPNITKGETELPPGCSGTACHPASAGNAYPEVFNNDAADESFGIASPIYLDQVDPNTGHLISTIPVPTSDLVTSFSSKSELALNLSTSGQLVSFFGYSASTGSSAAPGTLDVSASNTPGEFDSTNPVSETDYRTVGTMNGAGEFHFTETNDYTGDNARAAIIADGPPAGPPPPFSAPEETVFPVIFGAGNAGNGKATFNGNKTQFAGVIEGTGAQAIAPSIGPEAFQSPGGPTPAGSFSPTQLGNKADKIGKDTNFRGLTIFDNVVYFTKGSGSNGINTVYFIDTTGKACPSTSSTPGTGVPQPGAKLPSAPIPYNPAEIPTKGIYPYNMCILKGFPTSLANSETVTPSYPFGIWFANADTLYLADEGNGGNAYSTETGTYTEAASDKTSGLQKWVFNKSAGEWKLAYTLQNGLNLGVPYTVADNPPEFPTYPTGDNPVTELPWAPATDGLRNITGRVNGDGTATIWAVTSTVSGDDDQGADPNKVVSITDPLAATTPASCETFKTIEEAKAGEVLRGVAFTPGTTTPTLAPPRPGVICPPPAHPGP